MVGFVREGMLDSCGPEVVPSSICVDTEAEVDFEVRRCRGAREREVHSGSN